MANQLISTSDAPERWMVKGAVAARAMTMVPMSRHAASEAAARLVIGKAGCMENGMLLCDTGLCVWMEGQREVGRPALQRGPKRDEKAYGTGDSLHKDFS